MGVCLFVFGSYQYLQMVVEVIIQLKLFGEKIQGEEVQKEKSVENEFTGSINFKGKKKGVF